MIIVDIMSIQNKLIIHSFNCSIFKLSIEDVIPWIIVLFPILKMGGGKFLKN